MFLSVVTTLFYSASYIEEFYQRTRICVEAITPDYEIIFVNDGSPDNSLNIALSLREHDKQRIKIVDLSRNFGHHKAIMTGLSYAQGNLVFLIDSDLEEEPENLSIFMTKIKSEQVDVVYGVQRTRKGRWFEQSSGAIYYFLFKLLTGFETSANVLTARLMTRDYVQALVEHKEREFDIMGLWSLTGFKQSAVTVDKNSKGTTTYNLRRKGALFINTVTAFGNRPLLAILALGLFITASSVVAAFYLAIRHLFVQTIEGWAIVAVSVWLTGGLIIASLGMIGIYISKIYVETKQRPYTIVRRFYQDEDINK